MEVRDGDPQFVGLVDLFGDLLHGDRNMRRHLLHGDHAGGCEIDDQGSGHEMPPWTGM